MSAASAHGWGTAALAPVEFVAPLRALTRALYTYRSTALRTRAMGLDFPTPIGLAGGFDKNATRARALAALGFGFLELGTVTARAQAPNPAPNMFRLPKDHALVNRLGFPNEGAARVAERFVARGGARAVGVPVGFSIGKSRVVEVGEDPAPVVADYLESFRAVAPVSDFVVVNVSSPNTKNLRALQGPALARALLSALVDANREKKPLLLKVAPDLTDPELEALFALVGELGLAGVIATNTTVRREGLRSSDREVDAVGAGGLSGPPLFARALEVVGIARRALGPKATVIGVGGVTTGADVLAMMDAGASLVQLYTAFVYRGPAAAGAIAKEWLAAKRRRGD